MIVKLYNDDDHDGAVVMMTMMTIFNSVCCVFFLEFDFKTF